MKRRAFLRAGLATAAVAYLPVGRAFAADIAAVKMSGGETVLSAVEIEEFAASLRGVLLQASDPAYDAARRVWNAMFDKHPALIARCLSGADVVNAVNFARVHDLLVAVRCGGHNMAGKSVCEGGLVIDLSLMNSVQVNPNAKTARVAGGALLGHLDREAQAFGLATTAGVVSHTGVGGLTLGGGLGRLQRKYGLTIDNLLGVELVTADGRFVTANQYENADLYWGVRGGGGNFGIVTSFKFQLHKFGPEVLNFSFVYPLEQAREVLDFYLEFSADAPKELFVGGGLGMSADGKGVARIGGNYYAPFNHADRILQPLREFGNPTADRTRMLTYVGVQQAADKSNAHGQYHYAKGGFLTEIQPGLIDAIVENFSHSPGRKNSVSFLPMDGAVNDVRRTETAYPNRNALYHLDTSNVWTDPEKSEAYVQAGRDYWAELSPLVGGGFYVNSPLDRSQRRVRGNYGDNYERLVRLKDQYDPDNFFRLNANIEPTG